MCSVTRRTTNVWPESEQEIGAARETCDASLARVRVRLGQGDPVTQAFAQATVALQRIEASTVFIRRATDAGETKWVRETYFRKADFEFRRGTDAFLDAAVQRAGTSRPDDAQVTP